MRKIYKTLLWIALSLVVVVVLVIAFISPITKYLVEKYDVKYTGREVKMDWAYVNPFTAYVHLENLQILECESDSVFFSTKELLLDFGLLKALSGIYEISYLTLVQPKGIIIQDSTHFNFSDLIVQFGPHKNPEDTTVSEPVKFSILKVNVRDGEFHFHEKTIPIRYYVKNVQLESSGIRWDKDETQVQFALESGIGSGNIKGNARINLESLAYSSKISIRKFNMSLLSQYFKQISSYGTLRASLDADVKSKGNFNDPKQTDAQVKLDLSDFHLGKNKENDYASFALLKIRINRICPNKEIFDYDSIILKKPYFKYERYDSLDNVETMFGSNGSKVKNIVSDKTKFNLIIELAQYVKQISENLLKSQYTLKRLEIENGNFIYNDYTPREKFSLAAHPFALTADHIDKRKNHGTIRIHSGLEPFGKVAVSLEVYPKNIKDFTLNYHLEKVPVTLFNPFIITFTSFPLDRGTLELKGDWKVRKGRIKSENRLTIIDPRVGKKVKKKDTKWIPVPLILAVIRERGNVIDYNIPITGNLKDPKFNVWDPIWDVLGNIFIKPPTIAYGMHVRNVEAKVENSINVKWDSHSSATTKDTDKFLERMSDFLEDNPDAVLHLKPIIHESKEKEHISLYLAKKRFYKHKHKISNQKYSMDDSLSVEKMSNKSPDLLKYLNARMTDSLLFTIQHKSLNVVGEEIINNWYSILGKERINKFLSHFSEQQKNKQIVVEKTVESIPFNGFSLFEISYSGDFPEALKKEYSKYKDLNEGIMREYFKKKRKFKEVFY